MRKNTKKLAPIACAAIVVVLLALYIAVILFTLFTESLGDMIGILVVVVATGIILAAIIGVLAALRQRMKEIDKGEEEDAKIY